MAKAKKERGLTPKQQRFVEEYLVDLNATQAAIRAGYSRKTARKIGSENLSKPDIQAALTAAMEGRSKRCEFDADRVLLELKRIATFDLREAASWSHKDGVVFKASDKLDADTAAAISEVVCIETAREEVDEEGGDVIIKRRLSVKQHSKMKALELAAKYFGMLIEKREHTVNPGDNVQVVFTVPKNGRRPGE